MLFASQREPPQPTISSPTHGDQLVSVAGRFGLFAAILLRHVRPAAAVSMLMMSDLIMSDFQHRAPDIFFLRGLLRAPSNAPPFGCARASGPRLVIGAAALCPAAPINATRTYSKSGISFLPFQYLVSISTFASQLSQQTPDQRDDACGVGGASTTSAPPSCLSSRAPAPRTRRRRSAARGPRVPALFLE